MEGEHSGAYIDKFYVYFSYSKRLTHLGLDIEMDAGNIIKKENSSFLPFFLFAGGETVKVVSH